MRRKILFAALTVALFVAGFGLASFPALAELRTITITLVGGQEIVTTVDVPPGTPPDQIQLPEISAPIEKVEDGGPPPAEARADDNGGDDTADKPETDKAARRPASSSRRATRNEPKKKRKRTKPGAIRRPDGSPTRDNPTLTLGLPGPAPVGVPNFVINKFRIPPFLLPIYQAAGTQYGIRWEVLAAINEIETDYGRNLNVSSAGALGWMQFIPSSWRAYGTDANNDGEKDPYNPVDAIFAAARYLKAAGADNDLRRAIFAYNHADWYVDSVMMRARLIAGLPADLVGSLTGLTQGHFPVHAKARYADDLAERELRRLGKKIRRGAQRGQDRRVERPPPLDQHLQPPRRPGDRGQRRRRQEGRRATAKLGRYIVLQDVYGNRYTYAHLGKVSKRYPVPKQRDDQRARDEFRSARASSARQDCPKPTAPASAGTQQVADGRCRDRRQVPSATGAAARRAGRRSRRSGCSRTRAARQPPDRRGDGQLAGEAGFEVFSVYFSKVLRLKPSEVKLRTLKKGRRSSAAPSSAGSARSARAPARSSRPHLNFSIRPAGRGAPRIDPKPILDGWKLLEATAIYRAAGKNPFVDRAPARPDPADVEGGARRAACWPTPTSTSTRAAATTSAAARSTAACSRRSSSSRRRGCARRSPRSSAATATTPRRATSPTTLRATRSTSPRSTTPRSSATRAAARSPRTRSASC